MIENKNILKKPYSSLEYAKFASYCNQNILNIEDKGEYLEAIKYEIPLETLKQSKKEFLKINVENYFYNNYPQYKQNNISIFGTAEEKEAFKKFHDDVVSIYDLKVRQIEEAESKEDLDKIDINIEL